MARSNKIRYVRDRSPKSIGRHLPGVEQRFDNQYIAVSQVEDNNEGVDGWQVVQVFDAFNAMNRGTSLKIVSINNKLHSTRRGQNENSVDRLAVSLEGN